MQPLWNKQHSHIDYNSFDGIRNNITVSITQHLSLPAFQLLLAVMATCFLNHPELFILSLLSVAGHRIARSRDDIGRAATGAEFAAGAPGSMIIVSHTVPKSSCSLRFLCICLGEWWHHVMEDLQRLVCKGNATNAPYFRNRPCPYNLTNSEDVSFLKGFSLLFSENVAPCTPPENKDFTIISHLSQVLPESIGKLHQLQHLDVSHNCLMTLPKVMDQCLKAAKPPGFDGLWSSCMFVFWFGSPNLKNFKFRSNVGKNWYLYRIT